MVWNLTFGLCAGLQLVLLCLIKVHSKPDGAPEEKLACSVSLDSIEEIWTKNQHKQNISVFVKELLRERSSVRCRFLTWGLCSQMLQLFVADVTSELQSCTEKVLQVKWLKRPPAL